MNFTKYQHVERLGTTETDGILDGDVLVFPKIDGTNCSVWLGDDGDVHCSNRNKEIIDNSDGVGFYKTQSILQLSLLLHRLSQKKKK